MCVRSHFRLCGPMDCSLPGSSVHGIFQVRILKWVAISYSKGSSWPRDWTCFLIKIKTKANISTVVTSIHCTAGSAAAAAKSLQSCPTLCDPIDGSPSGSHVPGILQARILEWVLASTIRQEINKMERKKQSYRFLQMTWLSMYKTLQDQNQLLELINELCKVIGYKLNMQKSAVFLYPSK